MPLDVDGRLFDWERQESLNRRRANDLVPTSIRHQSAARKPPVGAGQRQRGLKRPERKAVGKRAALGRSF